MKEKQTNNIKTILKFSFRILFRQWRRFVLPFLSIFFTSLIIFSVLIFTNSSSDFLLSKNKELIGGDISIESSSKIEKEKLENIFGDGVDILKHSTVYDFSTILNFKEKNTSVSVSVVDKNYPLYGEVSIENDSFVYPKEDEIYLDKNAYQKLGVSLGDEVVYANTSYKVIGILDKDSDALFSGFGFLPKVIISEDGFLRNKIDTDLLRIEYKYNFLTEEITKNQKELISENLKDSGYEINIAGFTKLGFVEGFSIVEQFLVLVVLLSCVLASVNIYAGVLYLLKLMRKSFAVLLSLGFSKKNLIITLSFSLFIVLSFATILGIVFALFLFNFTSSFILSNFDILLTRIPVLPLVLLTFFITFSTAFASFLPSLKNLISLNPKELLSGKEEIKNKNLFKDIFFITLITLLPLFLIAIFLLESFWYGFLSILVITLTYVFFAVLFYFFILGIYRKRGKFFFMFRTLISQKFSDGIFGVISLTSLYIGLASLSLLILLQVSITSFLERDLADRLPSLYVVDIQKSQVEELKDNFKNLNLFPNVRARILSINNVNIQDTLSKEEDYSNRELGREYNLTYRNELLSSEKISSGKWSSEKSSVSVEKEFAKRFDIKLGSEIVFSISGFDLKVVVDSLREVDSRSGLPFFYFVFSPSDLESFPSTFFGYTYQEEEGKNDLTNFLAQNFPNISTIDTFEVSNIAKDLISGLLLIVFIVSIPPLILALFLIITLIISSFSGRRKQSAQLLALGARKNFIERLYYFETVFSVLLGSLLGYITAVLGVLFLIKFYLKLNTVVFYDMELLIFLGAIILFVFVVAFLIWRSDKRPLRELLSYEEN